MKYLKILTVFGVTGALLSSSLSAEILNEWTFDSDADETGPSAVTNSGTEGITLGGASNAGGTYRVLGGQLVLTGQDAPEEKSRFNSGVFRNSLATAFSSGVMYLRWDASFDFSSPSDDKGQRAGIWWRNAAGNNANETGARLDDSGPTVDNAETPEDETEQTSVTRLNLVVNNVNEGSVSFGAEMGTCASIVEIDFESDTVRFWVDTSSALGAARFDFNDPVLIVPNAGIQGATLANIRSQFTGDFLADGISGHPLAVDLIRQATTWAETSGTSISTLATPLGAIDQNPGAREINTWLGRIYFDSSFFPWIYSPGNRWLYADPDGSADGLWLWSPGLRWVWSSAAAYSWFYVSELGAWAYSYGDESFWLIGTGALSFDELAALIAAD